MDYFYMLKLCATVLFGVALGVISSIPVGAVQLIVIKKALDHQIKPAISAACGSATSDLIYGSLTLFGFGAFLQNRKFQIVTYSLGVAVMIYLVYRTVKDRIALVQAEEPIIYKKRYAYLKGFTIAITNPGMIVWWIVGYNLYLDLNLFTEVSAGVKALFVASGCLGLGGYLVFIAALVYRVKKSFPDKFVHTAYHFLTVLLSLLIVYFLYKLVCVFGNYHTII